VTIGEPMARFDVYANPTAVERANTPYVLDVQNDHLGPLGTRVVIPLRWPKGFGARAPDINPAIEVEGKELILDTASLAPVPVVMLKKPVARASAASDRILDALDTLFGAY
jgi:toxin CcdB